jgi:hypothetical protein
MKIEPLCVAVCLIHTICTSAVHPQIPEIVIWGLAPTNDDAGLVRVLKNKEKSVLTND